MKPRIRLTLVVVLIALVLSGVAHAQVRRVSLPPLVPPPPVRPIPQNANVWECWFTGNAIACRLARKADPAGPGAIVQSNQEIDRRLPEVVDSIRNYPETLEGDRIVIPVIGVPIDLTFVAELADSVMCNGRLDCGVIFIK
jgi:hypothetical protein